MTMQFRLVHLILRPLVLVVPLLLFGAFAQAGSVVLTPSSPTAVVGGSFSVEVRLTDLVAGQALGSFDLDLIFDGTLATARSVVFGSALGADLFSNAVLSAGRIDFAAVSLLAEADLLALQGVDFVLAQLFFDALAPGALSVGFDAGNALFGDAFGDPLALDLGASANLTLLPGGIVPEPSSLALLGVAIAAAAWARRRLTASGAVAHCHTT